MICINIDIIGGGIAGISSAISIKEHNKSINVTIHEKHKQIGYNLEGRRCGEAHSIENEWNKWIPSENSIYNYITNAEGFIGDTRIVYLRKKGTAFILNRQEFINQLSKQAEKLDVIIQTNNKIKSVKNLNSDYIIDASGCPSLVKRELGLDKGIKGITYQQTLENSNYFNSDTIKIFIYSNYGYFWIFPRDPDKKEVNVGIGCAGNFELNLKKVLEKFKEDHKIEGKINHVTGGLLPLGLQRPFMYKNILFVGDSGVGTFPLSGQGIYRALLSGDIAGKCIAKGNPKKYPFIINREFLKWDFIGKAFIFLNYRLRKINTNLVLTSHRYIYKILKSINL